MFEILRVSLEYSFYTAVVITFVPVDTVINFRCIFKGVNKLLYRYKGIKLFFFIFYHNIINVLFNYFDVGEFEMDFGGDI